MERPGGYSWRGMSWSHTGVHSAAAATDTHTGKEQVRENEGRKQRNKPTTRLPQQQQDRILVSGSAMCCDCDSLVKWMFIELSKYCIGLFFDGRRNEYQGWLCVHHDAEEEMTLFCHPKESYVFSYTCMDAMGARKRKKKAVQLHTKMNHRVMRWKTKFDWTSMLAGS